ncbi:fumarylacetoacetate hydrolase family protein [Streptomyces sp. NBC_00258]|uniref:fumarylacetoacetate hydrolase family protein n=1 Tax=Streptomyces sp. NBC_00258 TaxID=2903642 RepID=UPI002E2984D4|nr:fumarylacetoacetate hydrolase family protein [Streptomyces sp. NBC_00258]
MEGLVTASQETDADGITPSKIICIGLNYREHAREIDAPLPERPLLFAKWPNTLIGDGDDIKVPTVSTKVDFEAELGVVIGRRGRAIAVEDALQYVAAYVAANDVSARDVQTSDGQWVRGKSFDTFLPISTRRPATEVGDPQALAMRTFVNGQVMQESTTGDMIFSVAELIAFVSEAITLEAGDLLLTGTPAGIGAVRKPPVWLQPGDVVTVEIDGVGRVSNPVVAG